jgi:hypothetical protein
MFTVSFIEQTVIQLIVAAIAFLAGFFLQRIRTAWAYLRARRFWRPLLRRDLALILGDGFLDLQNFEASNVVGRGDLVASYELTSHFSRMGFRRLQPTFADRMIGTDLSGRELRRNLVVVGGPDANRICQSCIEGMQLSYALEWVQPSISSNESAAVIQRQLPRLVFNGSQQEEDSVFEPLAEKGEIVRDYGILIRSRNPFMPLGMRPTKPKRGKRVVMIYGCYGYGTLAAALYSQTSEFLEMVRNESDDIECIVRCRVVEGTPQKPERVYFKTHPYGTLSKDFRN